MLPGEPVAAAEQVAADDAFDVLVIAVPVGGTSKLCAIRASDVREVARLERVTPYPGAPADVPGVTALRGQIVPVLFLAPPDVASGPAILVSDGREALVLAGAGPTRVTGARWSTAPRDPRVVLWSGRELPLAGAVRLEDAARPDAAGGPPLPLLDAAALIAAAVDDTDGER